MITRLAENKEYLQKKKEHGIMYAEQRAANMELHKLKYRLQELEGDPLGWKEKEQVRKAYGLAEKKVNELQAKKDISFIDIVEQVKTEARKEGFLLSKKIVKALRELEQCKKDYLELRKNWREYAQLTGKITDSQIEGIAGPYCGDNVFHEPTMRNFTDSSEKYQKDVKADEVEK